VDAAECDHLGVGVGRLAGQPQRVADVVGDVLDLGHLVVVGEDHGVALGRERSHLVAQLGDLAVAQVEDRYRLLNRRKLSQWVPRLAA
jgi:hypothetical protein